MGRRRCEEPVLTRPAPTLRLPAALEARGDRLIHLASVGSTMDEARGVIAEAMTGALWIVADAQEAGRGRGGRHWRSPPGNLHMTLATRARLALRDQPKLGFAAGVALAEAAARLLPAKAAIRIKWPNDLLLDGAKASGILLEGLGQGDVIAIGIGVNVVGHPADTPYPATDLASFDAAIDRDRLFPVLAEALAQEIERLVSEGFAPLRLRWLARAAHLGGRIAVRRGNDTLEGRFVDIDEDGRLILKADHGFVRIEAGDVFPLDKAAREGQELESEQLSHEETAP